MQERTQELAGRNRDLRLVLDTVDQALLTIDLSGRVAPERSSVTDAWFGTYVGSPRFVEYVGADRRFTVIFELGLEGLRDGVLPAEIYLEQLPKRLERGAKQFDCRYLPIEERGALKGLLLVIDDVTERLARAREEGEQRELMAAFIALMRDRNGFLTFCDESERILDELSQTATEGLLQKRLLHTLKGNAAVFGLHLVSELCHQAESELDQGLPCNRSLDHLRARWSEIRRTLQGAAAEQLRSTIEISKDDLQELSARALQGASAAEVIGEIRRLSWESSARPLGRLAQHAQALASRLGKGLLEVEIEVDDARLEPERWAPLWSELVHVVRNAVDHGIETPEERDVAGKARVGRLRLATHRVGTGYRIEVEDDGRGIDWEAIRIRCAERGQPNATRAELVDAMLSADFSTRRQVTDMSGRGMGLAALAGVVRELGGHVDVESESGQGARWVVTVPSFEVPKVLSG
ncbi:MAG TPA: ATP-binding protein [Polyangiaceae bacterium]|nr:ATP-binding protein [Polyangiaceae bacterium]